MHIKHTQLFEQFSATFKPNTIIEWDKLINAWKKDRSQPNPYLGKQRVFIWIFILTVVISYNLTGCAT